MKKLAQSYLKIMIVLEYYSIDFEQVAFVVAFRIFVRLMCYFMDFEHKKCNFQISKSDSGMNFKAVLGG